MNLSGWPSYVECSENDLFLVRTKSFGSDSADGVLYNHTIIDIQLIQNFFVEAMTPAKLGGKGFQNRRQGEVVK